MTNVISDHGPSPQAMPHNDEDILRFVGQMIMVVFDGLSVTPDIQTMIEKYYVGNILLTARNIRDGVQIASLTQELQKVAQAAGFHYPLMIGIEQENGMISRLGDGIRATHFPGAMALGATRSPNQAFDIAKATAKELTAVGINWNFGPVLDVISEHGNATVSVRAFGDDPQMVGRFGVAFAEGLRAGGVGHCAKHFPGISSTRDGRRGSVFHAKSNDEIESTEMVPFRRAVAAGLDSVMLSSSIWPGNHADDEDGNAARAQHIIREVLRRQLGYDGVTMCDVTDMPIFVRDPNNIGIAVVTAIASGCDMIQIYHNPAVQMQGIRAIYEAIETNRIQRSDIYRSSSLILRLKDHYFSWRTALAAPDPQRLPNLMEQHRSIARKAYENAITVVRDERTLIPLSSKITPKDEVLLLSPVVRPLYQRAAGEPTMDPFECFGRALSHRHPRIIHAPYTAHGITQTHVSLIKRCSAIIFITSNATRPSAKSQVQTAGAVNRLCYNKPMINLAVCDPYDLLDDRKYGTYICTYEYSSTALETAAEVIFGERHAAGVLPVQVPGAPAPRQQRSWFVEVWEKRRDLYASADLWQDCLGRRWPLDAGTLSALLDRPGFSKHFVVRHTTTLELLGLCATYIIMLGNNKVIGSLALLLVRPTHRFVKPSPLPSPVLFYSSLLPPPLTFPRSDLGVGLSLHDVAVRHLRKTPGITSMQLGSIFPRLFPGLPVDLPQDDLAWFAHRGWKLEDNFVYDLFMPIDNFLITDNLSAQLAEQGITINNCRPGDQFEALIDFEEKYFGSYPGWLEKYHALRESDDIADAIVAFKNDDAAGATGGVEEILGAVLIFSPVGNNQISKDIPWPKVIGDRIGGLGFVGVKPEFRDLGVRKGLIVAAILELKQRGLRGCFIDWADDIETYTSLGFREWGKYHEVWRKI